MATAKSIRMPDMLLAEINKYQKAVGENFTDSVIILLRLGLSVADQNNGVGTNAIKEKLDELTRLTVQIAALTSALVEESGGDQLLEDAEVHATEMLKEMGI